MEAYLDHNATTFIDPACLELLIKSYQTSYANPSSVHALGRKAKARYLKAKDVISSHMGTNAKNIFFTSSATEALNWLLTSKRYKHIISSNLEHSAIYNCLKKLEKDGVKVTFIDPGISGYVSADLVSSEISQQTDLIILGSANSETGIIQPISDIAKLAKSYKIPFFVDAVGHFGRESFTFDPNVTGYVISSHKIHGPLGIALLSTNDPSSLMPWTVGGHQEGGKRAGTENMPAALAFSQAFTAVMQNTQNFEEMRAKRDYFESKLKEALEIEIMGENEKRVANTSSIRFIDINGETLLHLLDQHGVYASHGSACSSGALEPSRVIFNMKKNKIAASETLRFSISKDTSYQILDFAIDKIIALACSLKKLASL